MNSTDMAGNAATATVQYRVSYAICALYDQAKASKSGSTIPVKLALCDASGNDVSSSGIAVTSAGYRRAGDPPPSMPSQDSGNANPGLGFRYSADLGTAGGYIYNLQTKGIGAGTYSLYFTAAGDDQMHSVQFVIK